MLFTPAVSGLNVVADGCTLQQNYAFYRHKENPEPHSCRDSDISDVRELLIIRHHHAYILCVFILNEILVAAFTEQKT